MKRCEEEIFYIKRRSREGEGLREETIGFLIGFSFRGYLARLLGDRGEREDDITEGRIERSSSFKRLGLRG